MPPFDDIKILRVTYLRGPNIWTYRAALETWLDIDALEDWPSNKVPGLTDRLTQWLPGMVEHRCGVGDRGGFLLRLREGTWAGHVLEHVVIELLNLGGMPTGFGQTRSTASPGVYRMVFRARDEHVARAALEAGHRLLMAAINDQAFDIEAAVSLVRDSINRSYLGPSTAAIVAAATDRQIPHLRLNDGNLVQLGYGAHQRRIWTAETERTSAIGEAISREKDLTKELLRACGVPVPEGRIVTDASDAWDAAEDIGLPVVVKPTDGNHGRGVALNLKKRADIETAFAVAKAEGSGVMVERVIAGDEHRMLVVGDRLVAAARGESLWVTGDGAGSVRELIASQINSDPRRGNNEDDPLNLVKIDEDFALVLDLQRQGLTPDGVPEAGQRVLIQRNGNVSNDCTDEVHPEVARVVVLAARAVGLDIAGVDVVATDIGRPLAEQGGAVVEVNAGPGLLMHLKPALGEPRPVGRAIVDHLFPDDADARIPLVGVAGSRHTTFVAELLTALIQLSGCRVGLASRKGLFLDRRCVDARDGVNWHAGRRLLMNRNVDAAVFENDAALILNEGLVYDRCQVGVVTDVSDDAALREHDVHDADQVARVLRTQVDVVLGDGVAVLNAADPRTLAMAELCDGSVILYAQDATLGALASHRAAGGRVAFLRDGVAVLAQGPDEQALVGVTDERRPGRSALPCPDSTLAAIAAAWAFGVPAELIAVGVENFEALPGKSSH